MGKSVNTVNINTGCKLSTVFSKRRSLSRFKWFITIYSTCYGDTNVRANAHQTKTYSYSHMEGHSRESRAEFKTF